MKKFMLLAILLMACSDPVKEVDTLTYVKDYKTDLCFAVYNGAQGFDYFSNVPCTDKVLEQIRISESANKKNK